MHPFLPALIPTVHGNPSDGRPKPSPSPRQALWASEARQNQRGYKLTLTIEEAMSSGLEPEMEQKTLYHCSANPLTACDLGPELPRSVRGGTGARKQKKYKLEPNKDPRWRREAGVFCKLHISEGERKGKASRDEEVTNGCRAMTECLVHKSPAAELLVHCFVFPRCPLPAHNLTTLHPPIPGRSISHVHTGSSQQP
ncbi:hypothetical protein CRENBAI_018945 [Crenichthys baileyi]|uniref:Uncharacterized protein n=1 Tax=Crenichthys baileyi TaxID=28760 RepID=A0AAV9SI12_9TELE